VILKAKQSGSLQSMPTPILYGLLSIKTQCYFLPTILNPATFNSRIELGGIFRTLSPGAGLLAGASATILKTASF
jgi:hypothetical protein